jgi:hypothetical protein
MTIKQERVCEVCTDPRTSATNSLHSGATASTASEAARRLKMEQQATDDYEAGLRSLGIQAEVVLSAGMRRFLRELREAAEKEREHR